MELCPFCTSEPEDVGHFLFKCEKYSPIRLEFYTSIADLEKSMNFDNLNLNEKLRYILNVESSTEATAICCKFLKNIYSKRLEDKATLIDQ